MGQDALLPLSGRVPTGDPTDSLTLLTLQTSILLHVSQPKDWLGIEADKKSSWSRKSKLNSPIQIYLSDNKQQMNKISCWL